MAHKANPVYESAYWLDRRQYVAGRAKLFLEVESKPDSKNGQE
ncbi:MULTISPECIES: hypothetical protein [Mesorhizobium]|nr:MULTISPECIES: hypothetical protein [Mesorhizobium]MDF3210262.1 hypothetical protein [Mesorhizobium sp. LMG15046]MDF3231291.1 hypothetical protein [Mesorhizobium sp. DSM 30133]